MTNTKQHEIEERIAELDRIWNMYQAGLITNQERFRYIEALSQAHSK